MRFKTSLQDWIRHTAVITAGILLIPGLLSGQQKKKSHHIRRSSVHHATRSRRSHPSRARHRGRYRRQTHSHAARVHLQPDRVTEIQQALIRDGYLHGDATGQWDDATRQAMQKFQQANGFQPTGLPEAKPLMKLGLGPHPLPETLDQSVAQADTQQGSPKTGDPSPDAAPSTTIPK